MNKTKNIMLTTLGKTRRYLNVEYYSCRDVSGKTKFCTGISAAEAGTKYILSQHEIDEIIVLGPEEALGQSDGCVEDLETFHTGCARLEDLSEFDFFCYRLSQYIDRIDIEANDILYYASADKRKSLYSRLRREMPRGKDGQFYKAATEAQAGEAFRKLNDSLKDARERRWMKHMMYRDMDSHFKLHSLRSNSGVRLRFVPLAQDQAKCFTAESIVRFVDSLTREHGQGLNLYMDLQGLGKADSYTMWSMLAMVNTADTRFRIGGIIQTRSVPDSFLHTVDDETHRYDVQKLLAGTQAFVKYGKVELLEEFCRSHEIRHPGVQNMLRAMRYIDTGVALCNMADLKYGIQALKHIFRQDISGSDPRGGAGLFSVMKKSIQRDYGKLLEGEEVDLPELIGWALNKQFYQQVLTMIESLVPADIVQRGILYYARDKQDVDKALAMWNVLYWNEIPKCRYVFKNPDHYFLKSYGRTAINNRQPRENVTRDLARCMVDQLRGADPQLCNMYSELGDDAMLYELLLSYYSVGNLRNQVSHANAQENALQQQEELQENKSFELLQQAIRRFLRIYASACEKTKDKQFPLRRISEAELRTYASRHRLQPLTGVSPDLLLENSYECQFNGQTIQIAVHMLRPEDAGE